MQKIYVDCETPETFDKIRKILSKIGCKWSRFGNILYDEDNREPWISRRYLVKEEGRDGYDWDWTTWRYPEIHWTKYLQYIEELEAQINHLEEITKK